MVLAQFRKVNPEHATRQLCYQPIQCTVRQQRDLTLAWSPPLQCWGALLRLRDATFHVERHIHQESKPEF